jgi:hypothetical protein
MAAVPQRHRVKGVATMDGDNEKTQPQELLEEVIGITHGDTPEFPTLAEQQEYWRQRDAEVAAEVEPLPFTCPTCLRKFKSPQAVRMHVARVHTKTILTVGQQGKTEKPTAFEDMPREAQAARRKWSLARRRAFNRKKRRAEFGLPDSPIKWPPLQPPPQKEPVAMIKHCPFCGKNVERFLA